MESDSSNMENPSDFLVGNIELIRKGKALDLAMGGGRNAVFLAEHGFNVEGVDVSEEAVKSARKLAVLHSVELKASVADLEKDYKITPNAYDCIICFNYLQRSLISDIKNGLKKGGAVIYETYIIDQAALGKPKKPDYLLKHNELLAMFRDFRCLQYREGIFENGSGVKAIAGIVAVKI